jgi:Helicase associated domain (HA2)
MWGWCEGRQRQCATRPVVGAASLTHTGICVGLGLVRPVLQNAMDPPASASVDKALEYLRLVGAVDHEENLTPLGQHLAHLPVRIPCIMRLLLFNTQQSQDAAISELRSSECAPMFRPFGDYVLPALVRPCGDLHAPDVVCHSQLGLCYCSLTLAWPSFLSWGCCSIALLSC